MAESRRRWLTTTPGKAQDLARWFVKGSANVTQTQYEVADNGVEMEFVFPRGRSPYRIRVFRDCLQANIEAAWVSAKRIHTFEFIPLQP